MSHSEEGQPTLECKHSPVANASFIDGQLGSYAGAGERAGASAIIFSAKLILL